MNVLVFAEHQHNKFSKAALGAVRAGLQLAQQSGGSCSAAVLGTGIEGLAKELAEYGVNTVYAVEHPALEHYVADAYAQALANLAKDKGFDVVVATASTVGKDLLPRVAVRLEAGRRVDPVAREVGDQPGRRATHSQGKTARDGAQSHRGLLTHRMNPIRRRELVLFHDHRDQWHRSSFKRPPSEARRPPMRRRRGGALATTMGIKGMTGLLIKCNRLVAPSIRNPSVADWRNRGSDA